jgi:hypothetical protein
MSKRKAAATDISRVSAFHFVQVDIDRAVAASLRPAACARSVSVQRLISDLLSTIANEPHLVDAVLDDK